VTARVLLLAATLAVAACGSAPQPPRSPAIGITEPNPALIGTVEPQYFRLLVPWRSLTGPDGTLDLGTPQSGCMRTLPPCRPWGGLTAQLQAVAAAQRAHPGRYRVVFVIYDTPDGIGRRSSCGGEPRALPPRLGAYARLVRALAGAAADVEVAGWSPWNEPNHPTFLADCNPAARYVELARTMRGIVGDRLVIGELGGEAPAFLAALPDDLLCGAVAVAQHDYVGGADPLPALEAALGRCRRPPPIWITETGARHDRLTLEQGCAMQAEALAGWARDPRIGAVFHSSVREDDTYPTGLLTTDLERPYPELDLWRRWAAGERPATCSTATAARAPGT
jgi:hypothetical protein